MKNNICIIELPSNLGLKEPKPGQEPGVKKLPDWLRQNGFYEMLKPTSIHRLTPPPYAMIPDEESGVNNANLIRDYAMRQANLLKHVLAQRALEQAPLCLMIGGDCSILIGNALALNQHGEFGLFYLDGHTDFIGPELSETGGAAGMDLAIVTGYGHPKLTNIHNCKPYLQERHVWCVGNREYTEEYVAPIKASGIEYYDLKRLRQSGTGNCVNSFLSHIETDQLDGFFIHFDVDVLNDDIMPAVDSRANDGLSYAELEQILYPLLKNKKAAGLEITILDPDLDPTGEYTQNFVLHVGQIIQKARSGPGS